jgi:hypothetical protein
MNEGKTIFFVVFNAISHKNPELDLIRIDGLGMGIKATPISCVANFIL